MHVGLHEPRRVGGHAGQHHDIRQQTHRLDGVEVVVVGTGTQDALQQHFGHQHVGRRHDELLRREADLLAARIGCLTHLDQHLFQGGLRQNGRRVQQVGHRRISRREALGAEVGVRAQDHAVTASVAGSEGAVDDVRCQRFQRLGHRLRRVLGEGRAHADVVTVLHQHLGQREGDAVLVERVALDEQLSAGVVRDRRAVRHGLSIAHAIQERFFLVGPRDAGLFREHLLVFVLALVVHAVERLVEDRRNDVAKIGTAHRGCHLSGPP